MRAIWAVLFLLALAPAVQAQELSVGTVTRPPFSMEVNGQDTGFSIELWAAVAGELGLEYTIRRADSFQEMLARARSGETDLAIANISITADREEVMDFSQPIFASGLQIMTPYNGGEGLSVLRVLLSRDLLTAIALAFALLFGGGMLMWWFERGKQEYFDKPAKQALFPAFWWALNLVVNGGFEERVPRSLFGRMFGVVLVLSSLFIVSIFVAKITAVLTVDAIQNNVSTVNDLYGRRIGTIEGSTAAHYLDSRDLRYVAYPDLTDLLEAFESGSLDAVVFDAPILAYYVQNTDGRARLAGPVFQRENYGIALPSGSELAEPVNRALLRLKENGTYARLYRKWFGNSPDL